MADFNKRFGGLRAGLMALAGGGLLAAAPVQAAEYINTLGALSQDNFRTLSEDLGSGLSFKGVVPAESLGVLGFDISASATGLKVPNRDLWRQASGGRHVPRWVGMAGVRVHKGLPGGVDIGAFYNSSSDNIRLYGGEVRWAFLRGSTFIPAMALRGSYSRLGGVSQLGLDTMGVDFSISKGFLMFTPYAGLGKVWVRSKPKGVPTLRKESFSQNKVFVGLNVNLGINFAAEVDRTGDVTSYSVKTGIRF